jgi:N-methylhydantoinase A
VITNPQPCIRIGADVGGTFTDVVAIDEAGRVWTHKVPSTPPNFEQAVLDALADLLRAADRSGAAVAEVAHGTTVATNAVLEQRGARTALITTRGFRDVLELRRIRAPQLYDLFFEKPPALVERALRFEIAERITADGQVLLAPDDAELAAIAASLARAGVESVAICLLHAYAFPQHEQLIGDYLRRRLPHVQISLSHEVLPERKEYERSATTAVNAYVQPVMRRYLAAMRDGLRALEIAAPLLIMQSAGGLTPDDDAALRPVYVLESGPAAGVLAAGIMARRMGAGSVITLDIGGTTAKASIVEGGAVAYSAEYEVGAALSGGSRLVGGGGELIRAPSIDIAEVGAGGGSIAYLDRAGGLRVGPRSAGALPGPACYGRGGALPTVTDANVVLGYIRTGHLADGQIGIDRDAAERAIRDQIATRLGMDLLQAADGIHRIANARTMRALRAVSTERGRDPREFALIAFGGAGPIHAAGLARELGNPQVRIPPLPGLFSALGLLLSGIEHHDIRSCMLAGPECIATGLRQIGAELRARMYERFQAEGFAAGQVALSWSADMRFQGQTSEIRIALSHAPEHARADQLRGTFEAEHERLYGHRSDPDNAVEVIAVRLIGRADLETQTSALTPTATYAPAERSRRAYFGPQWGMVETPVVARADLADGRNGPLLVDEYDSTTVIPPDMRARLDEQGQIVIDRNVQ